MSVTEPQFKVGEQYTREDVIRIVGEPPQRGGDWATGLHRARDGTHFIFCQIEAAGRTGHNYGNRWVGDRLDWSGKVGSQLRHQQYVHLLSGESPVLIFTREDNRDKFIYAGRARCIEKQDTVPVRILWGFDDPNEPRSERMPDEVGDPGQFVEGATRAVWVNIYERNPAARAKCIAAHGTRCSICGLDFGERYGEVGKGFIHVHHLRLLASVRTEHDVDPVKDLRPVCPNCHAVIHLRPDPFSIEDVRSMLQR